MARRRRGSMIDFAVDAAFAGAAAATTLWYRLPMFAWTSVVPIAQRQAEAARMVDEKSAAMVEGALLANMELMRIAGAAAAGRMRPQDIGSIPLALAAAGMRPAFRTVHANARRLNRRTLG
jgi:hypothetical protein